MHSLFHWLPSSEIPTLIKYKPVRQAGELGWKSEKGIRLSKRKAEIHTRGKKKKGRDFLCRMWCFGSNIFISIPEIINEISKISREILKITIKSIFPLYFLIFRLWGYRCDCKWKLKSITICGPFEKYHGKVLHENVLLYGKSECFFVQMEHLRWITPARETISPLPIFHVLGMDT